MQFYYYYKLNKVFSKPKKKEFPLCVSWNTNGWNFDKKKQSGSLYFNV